MFLLDIRKIRTVCGDTGSRFLQSPFWGEFKKTSGWTNLLFSVQARREDGHGSQFEMFISVLVRSFGKGIRFSIAYIPMAPELPVTETGSVSEDDYECLLFDFSVVLKKYLPPHTLCVRYDVPLDFFTCAERDSYNARLPAICVRRKIRLVKSKVDIQPPDTVLLDLLPSEDDILARMKPKWRYNIRLAQKKGVVIKAFHAEDPDFDTALDAFYTLFGTTAKRDGIAIHTKAYCRSLLEKSCSDRKKGEAPLVTLYLAQHEGDNLAAIITLYCRREAVYLYGASGNEKRNFMPAYLLQWTAICDAKRYGSPVYDFYGMPPEDDPHHPMYGLYRFKTGFGGKIVHRPGSLDVPLSRLYGLYTKAETLRAFYNKRIKKLLAGR